MLSPWGVFQHTFEVTRVLFPKEQYSEDAPFSAILATLDFFSLLINPKKVDYRVIHENVRMLFSNLSSGVTKMVHWCLSDPFFEDL